MASLVPRAEQPLSGESVKEKRNIREVEPVYRLRKLVAAVSMELFILLGHTACLLRSLQGYPRTRHPPVSLWGAEAKSPSHRGLHLAVTTPFQKESEAPLHTVECVASMRASTTIFRKSFSLFLLAQRIK